MPARTSSSACRIWLSSRSRPTSGDLSAGSRGRQDADDGGDHHRVLLSLHRQLGGIGPFEVRLDEPAGRFVHHDLARVRRRLEPRRDVHGVAERRVLDALPRADGSEDHRAGVHADAHAEALEAPGRGDLAGICGDVLRDAHGGTQRPLGVVLVRDGGAEQRQDAVAGQVLDRSAEGLDRVHDARHGLADDELDLLGVQPFAEGRRPDQVGEDGGDDLAFLPRPASVMRGILHREADELVWRPAVDATRVVIGAQLVAVVALLTLRSIAKARAKAKRKPSPAGSSRFASDQPSVGMPGSASG